MKGISHKILSVVLALVLVISMLAAVVAPASAVVGGALTVVPNPTTAGAGAGYTVTFSSGVGLVINVDTISLTFPAGTTMPTSMLKEYVTVNATALTVAPVVDGRKVTMISPVNVGAGGAVVVVISQLAGIKNPAAAGAAYVVAIETSADGAAVNSVAYAITLLVTFTPARAATGGTVTVTGVGFAANSSVDIGTVAGNNGALGAGTTDASGTFSVACIANAAAAISATDGAGNTANSAAALIIIPSITMTPTTAIVGTTITLTARGLIAANVYGISWADTLVDVVACTSGTIFAAVATGSAPDGVTAPATGIVTCTFLVPANSTPGNKTVGLRTAGAVAFANLAAFVAAADAATGTFTVPARTITLSPATGPAGATVTVTGVGFSAFAVAVGSAVTFNAAALVPPVTFATSGDGSFTSSIVVPVGTAAGTYAVAYTDSNGNAAQANFVIPAAAPASAVLSPATGGVGSSVTVTGANFRALSTVSVTFRTPVALVVSVVGTGTTDSAGNCSITFTVPTTEPGFATVTLTDAAGTARAVTYTVTQAPAVVTVANALSSVSTNVPTVWIFNAATQAWQLWDKNAPAVSDLANMTVGQGYWMQSTADCTLTFGLRTYALKAGWNLIGWLG